MPTDVKTLMKFDELELATTLGEATDICEGLAIHGASAERCAVLAGRITTLAEAAARAVEALKGADGNAD